MPTIESVAGTIDDALRVVSRAPFGPNYDPAKPFDEAIGELATAISPLPAQLRQLSQDFTGLGLVQPGDLHTVGVAGNRRAASRPATRPGRDARRPLRQDGDRGAVPHRGLPGASGHTARRTARVLLLLFGLVFAFGQIVPIWLGRELMTGGTGASAGAVATSVTIDEEAAQADEEAAGWHAS